MRSEPQSVLLTRRMSASATAVFRPSLHYRGKNWPWAARLLESSAITAVVRYLSAECMVCDVPRSHCLAVERTMDVYGQPLDEA